MNHCLDTVLAFLLTLCIACLNAFVSIGMAHSWCLQWVERKQRTTEGASPHVFAQTYAHQSYSHSKIQCLMTPSNQVHPGWSVEIGVSPLPNAGGDRAALHCRVSRF